MEVNALNGPVRLKLGPLGNHTLIPLPLSPQSPLETDKHIPALRQKRSIGKQALELSLEGIFLYLLTKINNNRILQISNLRYSASDNPSIL